MRKLLFISFLLIVCNIVSFQYLKLIYSQKEAYVFSNTTEDFLLQKKELLFDSIDDFVFEDYFMIISSNDKNYRYSFEDEKLRIALDHKQFTFDYSIKEPVIETVEKIVYKEVIVERKEETPPTTPSVSTNTPISYEEKEYEEAYFRISSSHLTFAQGTSINEIIETISSQVDTNMQVSIDYSSLNPNQIGQYTVNFVTESGNYQIIVEII